jgi:hypothetical protein
MSPADKQTSMSSEAYDLLDCFVDEFNDVIWEIAEKIAREKSNGGDTGSPVAIEESHVRDAASLVSKAIENSRPDLHDVVRDMVACMKSKLPRTE